MVEDVLNRAADRAYACRSLVTTEYLVDTLFDMSRDHTPRTIFHRHRPDFNLRDTGEPNAERAGGQAKSGERRQKVRVSAGSNPISDYPSIPTGVPTVTDTLQNTRMDEIERAIRALTEDMARNRSTFSALLGELRGGKGGYQPAPIFVPGPSNGHDPEDNSELAFLIERVERNVESKFNELARAGSVLGDRLGVLERAVEEIDVADARPVELTPEFEARLKALSFADDRLDKLETLLSSLPHRFSELERRLQNVASTDSGRENDNVIIGKIDQLERLVMSSNSDVASAKNYDVIIVKIDQLERLVMEAGGASNGIEIAPILSSLRDVEAGLRGIGGQLREVDERSGDVNLAVEGLGDRQKRMEDLVEGQQSFLLELKDELREDIGNAFVGRPDGTETISVAVGSVVSERFAGLANQFQGRIGQLEDMIRSALDRPATVVNNSGDIDNAFLTDAMTKIINNQHTLAGSIDEWRLQSRQDLSAISARIDNLEIRAPVAPELPLDRFNEISDRLDRIQLTLPDRQPVDGWSRFKLWLFGTNDWYAASWTEAREDERGWTAQRQQVEQPRGNGLPREGLQDRNV